MVPAFSYGARWSTALEIDILEEIPKTVNAKVRPMTMETRCSKVVFPNYSKKKQAEDTLVPPLWGTREKKCWFF